MKFLEVSPKSPRVKETLEDYNMVYLTNKRFSFEFLKFPEFEIHILYTSILSHFSIDFIYIIYFLYTVMDFIKNFNNQKETKKLRNLESVRNQETKKLQYWK